MRRGHANAANRVGQCKIVHMTNGQVHILPMRCGAHRFGVNLDAVERVFGRVDIRPLPLAPDVVCGVVNVHGTIAPVVDLQRRFATRDTPPDPGGRLVGVRTPTRLLLLLCDEVEDIVSLAPSAVAAMSAHVCAARPLPGVAVADSGLVYIYDPDQLLLGEEETSLAVALQREL